MNTRLFFNGIRFVVVVVGAGPRKRKQGRSTVLAFEGINFVVATIANDSFGDFFYTAAKVVVRCSLPIVNLIISLSVRQLANVSCLSN